jgi:hypothetical protein
MAAGGTGSSDDGQVVITYPLPADGRGHDETPILKFRSGPAAPGGRD